jgi:hypothetical protein
MKASIKPPVPQPTTVVLEMSKFEAEILDLICQRVTRGLPQRTIMYETATDFRQALKTAGLLVGALP